MEISSYKNTYKGASSLAFLFLSRIGSRNELHENMTSYLQLYLIFCENSFKYLSVTGA
jgi:hypothetical protein